VTDGVKALEIEHVSKSFVGVKAVSEASFTCEAGEVHALVGENGAGKSTLIKLAAGALRPDEGTVRICGQVLSPPSPLAARRLGLLTAYQDTSLVLGLTVAENVLLSFHGTRPLGLRLKYREAARLLADYDLPFSPADNVGELSPGSRQLLEIVRALIHNPKVLLLDEPTAALDSGNIARLEAMIETARSRDTAIVYISHRLDEVRRLAHRLTVIRDGRIQGTYDQGGWDVDQIVALMVGERTDLAFPPKPGVAADAPEALLASGFRGDGFGPVDLSVRKGEIVGIAGAEGNGQRELVRTLVGLRRGRGRLAVGGREGVIATPAEAIRRGISFQSGDRAAESVFRELSVIENSTLAIRGNLGPAGLILRSRQRQAFRPLATRLGIVRASDLQPAGELSGGNQQKAVLARSLLREAPVLVVDEPTAGVDARARLDIFRVLRDQADAGAAIIINSPDASELEGLCDRVYVMSRGRVTTELAGDRVDESTIVESFVNATNTQRSEDSAAAVAGGSALGRVVSVIRGSSWTPLAALILLLIVIGAYTAGRSSTFLTSVNLNNLLLSTLPLAIVALGQQALLIAGGFDISIGANMTLAVVLSSFYVTQGSFGGSIPGILIVIGAGVGIGLLNGVIVRVLGVSPIITTIGTLSILQGLALLLRPSPAGTVGTGLGDVLGKQVGFIPLFFIVVAVLAVVGDVVLRTTSPGLTTRATGLSEEATRRTGVRIEVVKLGAYVFGSVIAAIAGLFLAVQVGVGDPNAGTNFALPAFTACFLGGAALTGGKGSFVAALFGALFISLLTNITPLLNLNGGLSTLLTGVLTILAVLAYSFTQQGGRSRIRRSGTLDGPSAVSIEEGLPGAGVV
jgi:ribose transport system ATP-binding protein